MEEVFATRRRRLLHTSPLVSSRSAFQFDTAFHRGSEDAVGTGEVDGGDARARCD